MLAERVCLVLALAFAFAAASSDDAGAASTYEECRQERDALYQKWQAESRDYDRVYKECVATPASRYEACSRAANFEGRRTQIKNVREAYDGMGRHCDALKAIRDGARPQNSGSGAGSGSSTYRPPSSVSAPSSKPSAAISCRSCDNFCESDYSVAKCLVDGTFEYCHGRFRACQNMCARNCQ